MESTNSIKRKNGNLDVIPRASSDNSQNTSAPSTSVFRDPQIYSLVNRCNDTILSSISSDQNNRQLWFPYSHLFFNGRPTPVFCDYRQMFAGVTTSGSARYFATLQQNRTAVSSSSISPYVGTSNANVSTSAVPMAKVPSANGEVNKVDLAKEILESSSFPWEHGGLQRRWVQDNNVDASVSSLEGGRDFTVCSYNVLCQETLYENLQMYKNCEPAYLNWHYRWQLLQKEFSTMNADVCCLQEVEQRYYESHFLKFFQTRGYDGLFKCRLGAKPDGCAIFWRRNRFDISFSEMMDFQVANSISDRDNVALIVVLASKGSSPSKSTRQQANKNKIIIANTHLLFNPGRGDIKLCQLAMLLAKVRKVSRQSNDIDGLVLCGDFNSVPFYPLYNFLVEGHLHYVGLRRADVSGQQEKKGGPVIRYPLLPSGANIDESTCRETRFDTTGVVQAEEPGRLGHELNLVSAYGHRTSTGHGEVSTFHSREGTNVDYIFYKVGSKNIMRQRQEQSWSNANRNDEFQVRVSKLHRLCRRAVLALPSGEDLKKTVGMLPNKFCGSDHLPLMVEFDLVE